MKKLYNIFIIALLVSSCDLLDQEPEALILTENAIVDRQSATSAVNGLYSTLQNGDLYGGRFILANEMVSGNAEATAFQAFWQELATGRIPTSNFQIEGNWVALYNTANAANAVIEDVPKVAELSDGEKESLLAVAYFMRGLAHFDLLRQYGEFFDLSSNYGIPLKLDPTNDGQLVELERSTVAATYEQIERDINLAIGGLGNGSNFLATKSAARALLARVHLYKKEYAQAAALATTVINSGLYQLLPNYNTVYIEEGSLEAIFELEFIQLEDPNVWAVEMYASPPEVSVSSELVGFLNARGEDERGQFFEETGNNVFRTFKYGNSEQDNGGNTIILRISEMYLIRAEALALLGDPNDALPDLNEVRARAGLEPILNIDSDEALLNILLDERRAEFAFEGHYWFDMVRYDLVTERTGLEAFRKVFPIPFREMNITDGTLVQNPGYN